MPARLRDIPDAVTPDYVARQSLVLENAQGAVYGLVMQWLASRTPLPQAPMIIGTIDAVKVLVASGLGMSIVPAAAAIASPDVVVRPLQPAMTRTLALIQHRNKPEDFALAVVRNALLGLQLNQKAVTRGSGRIQRRRGTGSGRA
jgi:DNA-binding transcriptional LysR family regulator